jgi:hypothetical protein
VLLRVRQAADRRICLLEDDEARVRREAEARGDLGEEAGGQAAAACEVGADVLQGLSEGRVEELEEVHCVLMATWTGSSAGLRWRRNWVQ